MPLILGLFAESPGPCSAIQASQHVMVLPALEIILGSVCLCCFSLRFLKTNPQNVLFLVVLYLSDASSPWGLVLGALLLLVLPLAQVHLQIALLKNLLEERKGWEEVGGRPLVLQASDHAVWVGRSVIPSQTLARARETLRAL